MRILASILLLLLFVPGWAGRDKLSLYAPTVRFSAHRIALDPTDLARRRVGQLKWLGGMQLRSDDPAFGGFSALSVVGERFTLLSDGGNILRFTMDTGGHITAPEVGDLLAGPGTGWRKRDRDSESLAIDPRDGSAWVGFEGSNEIWRYDSRLAHVRAWQAPPAMADWGTNSGAETLIRLRSGALIAIAERSRWPNARGRAAIHFSGDPTRSPRRGFRFAYLPPEGFDPSDGVELPDGRLLILNRRFALPFVFSIKLEIVDPTRIRAGKLVRGREIATLAPPLVHDNFEGVAVSREQGRTIIWLVSDDNQLFLQRSLLLKFSLEADPPRRAARR